MLKYYYFRYVEVFHFNWKLVDISNLQMFWILSAVWQNATVIIGIIILFTVREMQIKFMQI